jgi:SecD/SecF fusion protein
MAVDSNVLIYERMREEKERGAALRMVIRNGFGRAMATIIDTHSTTIITGVILYVIGTEQLKGFAVTLVLGLVVNLFTAVFCARVVFDIAERQRWLTKLKMLKLFGETSIDFVGITKPAIVVSTIISVVGVVAAYDRGKGLWDVDFTGGSSVQIVLRPDKGMDVSQVRKLVDNEKEAKILPDVTVNAVTTKGQENQQFVVRTSNDDIKRVEEELTQLFGDRLRTYQIGEFKNLRRIKAAEIKPPPRETIDQAKPAAEFVPAAGKSKSEAAPKSSDPKPPAKPEPGKGSSLPRLDRLILALAGPEAFLAADADAQPNATGAKDDPKPPTEPPKTDATKPEIKAEPKRAETKEPSDEKSAKETETPQTALPTVGAETFVGGTEVMLSFDEPIKYDSLKELLDKAVEKKEVRFELSNPDYKPGSSHTYPEWTLRMNLPPEQATPLLNEFKQRLAATPVFLGDSKISGRVAGDTKVTAAYALVASILMIVVYIWIRFQNVIFGLGAVVALVHDVLVTVAGLAISYYVADYLGFLLVDPFKISLNVVAALLTIVGYSISDTIVIFDRIREVRGKSPDLTEEMINKSVNQTLSRTVLTVFTVLLVTIILYIAGGQAIHAFAFTMLIGLISGTYSSVYIAAPVLLWLKLPGGTQQVRKSAA